MRKKINRGFLFILVPLIVIMTTSMSLVFYAQLKKQVFSDLEMIVSILLEEGIYEKKTKELRITLVGLDGRILFDSTVDATKLKNHRNRPEIKAAWEYGSGKAVRRSDTLSESVFYYAKKTGDGKILRVGKEAKSVFSVMVSTLPIVGFVTLLLGGISFLASHYLTASIVKPIDEMVHDMDHVKGDGYPELIPFLRKIRVQHEEILHAANLRQEFTANVSHELKTPLAAISGYAELMEMGIAKEEDGRRFAGEIRKSAARLLTLINDIMKLSQLDENQAKEVLEVVDLAAIGKESVEMLSLGASKRKVTLEFKGRGGKVRIGKELAQELFYNLIENGIRYNRPGGKVYVSVYQDEIYTRLRIKDTGIGISKEHQERIFERFYRVDKSRSKELGGTGLGLAIVKHICTLTEGKLTLESLPGVGTTIEITWENK